MKYRVSSKIMLFYNIACWTATIALTTYWVNIFIKDEDLSRVEYKKYFTEKSDVFPVMSFCIKDPISSKKLGQNISNVSVLNYLDFLKGKYLDPSILRIKYEDIIKNMSDYIEEDSIKYRNSTILTIHSAYTKDLEYGDEKHNHGSGNKQLFPLHTAFLDSGDLFNCYSLKFQNDRNIETVWYRVKSSIFLNGTRLNRKELWTFLHYPNQLMISKKTLKYMWPQQRKKHESYLMRFDITGVELLRRRQKRSRPCSVFWADYDNEIKTKHSVDIGCKLPYINLEQNMTSCKDKAQMKKAFIIRSDDYGVLPPCQTMEKINYLYSERTLDIKKDSWARRGYFWLGISIAQDHFKEIVQTK